MKKIILFVFMLSLLSCICVGCAEKPSSEISVYDVIGRNIAEIKDSRITKIGAHAFEGCEKLRLIDLSESEWIMIGEKAFSDCYNLEIVMFPVFVLIDDEAFLNCSNLFTVVFNEIAYGEPYVGEAVFAGTPIAKGEGFIYVPCDQVDMAVELFEEYKDRIRAIDDLNIVW